MLAPRKTPEAPARLVVLDDNHITRTLLRRLLEHQLAAEVILCANIGELLEIASPPDLYLLDIVLGDECGIDACLRLKARPDHEDVPVVFFSEHAKPQTRLDALRAGGVDYIDKPFFPAEFIQRVRGALERHRRQIELQKQSLEQQALLRVLCHDLRNSVGSAHTLLTHFSPDNPGDVLAPYHDLARQAAQSALELIDHVAEYRSLLAQDQPLRLESVDVAEAIQLSLRLLEPAARAKGLQLLSVAPAGLTVLAHRVVLVHNILNNLLSNAIKFTRPGGRVRIEAVVTDQLPENPPTTAPSVQLRVIDDGIGLPADLLCRLDQPGPLPSRPGTAHELGTGMGLQLVRLHVARCGGTLRLQSPAAPNHPPETPGTLALLEFPAANLAKAAQQ